MTYIKVRWIHQDRDSPIWLLCELDAHRWEIRKIEVFADGSKGYTNGTEEIRGTRLSELPIPSLAEIAADPQFVPLEITGEEFEAAWSARDIPAKLVP